QPAPDFNPLDAKYIYSKNIIIKPLGYLNDKDVPYYDSRFSIRRNLEYILELIKDKRLNASDILTEEIYFKDLGKQYDK
ncbi:hypothetical protein ABTL59_19855, partial [Acinetobacter baumannii]